MAQAAAVILDAAHGDKRVYVFGTGHSHMLAEEVHYRAERARFHRAGARRLGHAA